MSFLLNKKSFLPSKILDKTPGPSSIDKGLPVRKTGSPTVTPAKQINIKMFLSLIK
jgi:hypothetical protein